MFLKNKVISNVKQYQSIETIYTLHSSKSHKVLKQRIIHMQIEIHSMTCVVFGDCIYE